MLCTSCGRIHPICLLFQIREYERTLEDIRYNWKGIRESISDILNEKEKLKKRRRKLKEIVLLKKIKNTKDSKIFELLKKVSLEGEIDLDRLKELLDEELVMSKRYSEIKSQLAYVSQSWFRKFLYLLRKAFRLDKKEKELADIEQRLKIIQNGKKELFNQIEVILDKKISALRDELKKLPRTKYRNLESLNQELQMKLNSLTTESQQKLIEILKKQGIITESYDLREDAIVKLMERDRCFSCGGEVKSMPPPSFFFIACPSAILVSDSLLAFATEKERFIDNFRLYQQLVEDVY